MDSNGKKSQERWGSENIPPLITAEELRQKLEHLTEILYAERVAGILLQGEGALRWLTGLKHQLGDIAPSAVSPVQVLVRILSTGSFDITLISKPFEMPRLKDEIPRIFGELLGIEFRFVESIPPLGVEILTPEYARYAVVVDRLVRPLAGGLFGNSYKKLEWLSRMAMQSLSETAEQLEPGMHGMAVRGLLLNQLASRGVDANLVLVALMGQETHLHPVASAQYWVEKNRWMKLVVGARYAEHIVSQSLMVKLGGVASNQETEVYHALQQAAVEYADLYRTGAQEHEIHEGMMERFQCLERDTGLTGFGKSATLHHPGGGTSPLGNRDRMIDSGGIRTYEPWTQFAINPVDVLCDFKVELQGVILPDGNPPQILDMHSAAPSIPFRAVEAGGGTQAILPELLVI